MGSIWKEAFKSLLYFFIFFIVLVYPIRFLLDLTLSDYVEQRLSDHFHFSIIVGTVLLSPLLSYLVLMFFRDNYFYRIVRLELGKDSIGSAGLMNQLKSLLRVLFLLVMTVVGILISFFMPVLGFLLMSFCFALEVFSYVFDESRVGLSDSLRFIMQNFLAAFVLGSFCFLSSIVPGLGLVTYPVSVRAATLFFKTKVIDATS
jgi:hypothetical protein